MIIIKGRKKRGTNENHRESTKFLEMTLDSRLNWEEHIGRIRPKAKRAINTIKVAACKKWEGDWKTLKSVKCNIKDRI